MPRRRRRNSPWLEEPSVQGSPAPTAVPLDDPYLQEAINAHLAGRPEEAASIYEQFVEARYPNSVAYTNLAAIRLDQGREDGAIALWRQALALRSDLPDAWYDLGNVMMRRQASEEAIACFEKALAIQPEHLEALINYSSVLINRGDHEAGFRTAEKALTIQPHCPEAACNAASALRLANRLEEAEQMARRAVALNPQLPQSLGVLTSILKDKGEPSAAELVLREALALGPTATKLHVYLADFLRGQNRLLEATDLYRKAVALDPALVEGWGGLGHCYFELNDTTNSIDAYRYQQALQPEVAEVSYNLGVVLKHQGDLEAAAAAYAEALRLQPDYELALHGLIYTLNFAHLQPMATIAAYNRDWCDKHYPSEDRGPFEGKTIPLGGKKLRIGILSAEIGGHAVSFFLESFLQYYDRDAMEVILYESHERAGDHRLRLLDLVDGARPVYALRDGDARQTIINDQIDILVDTTSCMRSSRLGLLASRCAPIQCHYIGFHGSTGVRAVDYYIGDPEYTPVEFDSHLIEKVWRLPRCFVAYQKPENLPPPSSDPQQPLTFGCFNNLTKVRAETLDLWVDVLKALPEARLLLKDMRCGDLANRERILRHLCMKGINRQRIELVDRVADWHGHMALYNRIDIALDTIPLNSGTTGFDALVMGVPLVAMRGDWMGARLTSSMLKALGRPEWIAETRDGYVQILQKLAADRPALAELKQQLRAQVLASELCDQRGLANDLEEAFRGMAATLNP